MQRRKCKVAKTKDIALLRSWKGERMKQIQIPEQLFMELVKFGNERFIFKIQNCAHRGRTGTGEKRISGQTRSAGEIPVVILL